MTASNAAGVRDSSTTSGEDGYFEWTRPELRALVPDSARRVLDVGCGAGALGGTLREERGIEVIGVELFPDAAERAAERLDEAIVADLDALESLPYPDGHFDTMIFGDVLEHLRDPHRLLRALRRYLADDGVLVCSFPNVKHWSVVFPLVVQDRWRYEDAGLLDRTHVHFFTLDEIDLMLRATGYGATCAQPVVHPMPHELTPLVDAAVRLGGERTEVAARLSAYQYLIVAAPLPDAPVQRTAPAATVEPVVLRAKPPLVGDAAGEAPAATSPAAAEAPAPAPAGEAVQPAAAGAATASLLVVLDGSEQEAMRCLTAISELHADQPPHDIVVVADCAPQLDGLLDLLDGDVTVVRTDRPEGFSAAASRGLPHCDGEVVVLLHGAPTVSPGFLAPLVAALDDAGTAAAASVLTAGSDAPAVATAALAARRADLPRSLPIAPSGFELPAICALLARRGEVLAAAGSVASRPGSAGSLMRRAPGEPIELSIVIPTLDAAGERVRRCIAAAQASTTVAHEIVVIDNGAPPQGFTAPVNAGLRAARGRYLLVLNDDVELLPGWWEPLRDALDRGAAVAFPETVDGPMRYDFAAWCFALTREVLEEFAVAEGEFLDPEMVVWYQDTDLLERLRAAGRPPLHVPASRIRHLLSATVNSDEPALRTWVARQVLADKEAFEAKHAPGGGAGAARDGERGGVATAVRPRRASRDTATTASASASATATVPAPSATTSTGSTASAAAGIRRDAQADVDQLYYQGTREDLRRLVPESARRVLDVGCGAGALGGTLREERGIEVAGIELFADAAAIAAQRLDHVTVADLDTLQELPFEPGHFDAMTFGDVLEHLRDPHRLLRTLRPYLADDGVLVCSIPNVKHWSVVMPLLLEDRWQYQDSGLLDRTHVHFFTLEEIDAMLTETGFAATHLEPISIAVPPRVEPLLDVVARLGGDRAEQRQRLAAYQYLIVARPV